MLINNCASDTTLYLYCHTALDLWKWTLALLYWESGIGFSNKLWYELLYSNTVGDLCMLMYWAAISGSLY